MKKILSLLALTLIVNQSTSYADCISKFENKTSSNIERDGVVGASVALGSFFGLSLVIGPFALIPIGAGAVWVYKDMYLPSSATKMSQLVLDSYLLYEMPTDAETVLKKDPHALKRLDLVTERATGLTKKNGVEFNSKRSEIAKIIVDADANGQLCNPKLIKFRNVDEFVRGKL